MKSGQKSANCDFSIVIPTIGRVEALKECLYSILMQRVYPLEIIIIDSSQGESVAKLLTELKSQMTDRGIKFMRAGVSYRNVSKQKNYGVQLAQSNIVCFLDDDVILDSNYLHVIKETFRLSPDIVGVGGHVASARTDNLLKRLYKRIFLLNHDQGLGTLQRSGFPATPFRRQIGHPMVTQLLTGCACYKRDAAIKVRGFDEELGITRLWEDVDLPLKLSRKARLIYNPDAKMIHKYAPGGRFSTYMYSTCYFYNHFYLFHKYVKPSLLNWLCFVWSHFGALGYMLALGYIRRDILSAIRGIIKGNFWTAKRIMVGWRPSYDDVEKN